MNEIIERVAKSTGLPEDGKRMQILKAQTNRVTRRLQNFRLKIMHLNGKLVSC